MDHIGLGSLLVFSTPRSFSPGVAASDSFLSLPLNATPPGDFEFTTKLKLGGPLPGRRPANVVEAGKPSRPSPLVNSTNPPGQFDTSGQLDQAPWSCDKLKTASATKSDKLKTSLSGVG